MYYTRKPWRRRWTLRISQRCLLGKHEWWVSRMWVKDDPCASACRERDIGVTLDCTWAQDVTWTSTNRLDPIIGHSWTFPGHIRWSTNHVTSHRHQGRLTNCRGGDRDVSWRLVADWFRRYYILLIHVNVVNKCRLHKHLKIADTISVLTTGLPYFFIF